MWRKIAISLIHLVLRVSQRTPDAAPSEGMVTMDQIPIWKSVGW